MGELPPLSVQALQDVLTSDPDEGRRKMGDLSRKATLLMVNERTLSRRLSLAQDAEKQLRKVSGWSVGECVVREWAELVVEHCIFCECKTLQ